MPRGDKSKYTSKQRRQARKIEKGYEHRGVSKERSGAARLGDSEQDDRRRPPGRLRRGQAREQGAGPQGRTHRRAGGGVPPGGRAIGLGPQGGAHAGTAKALKARVATRRATG